MTSDLRAEERLYHAALAVTAGAERQAFLENSCRGDHQLLGRLHALLGAHDGQLDATAKHGPLRGLDAEQRIGRFEILEEVGRGGCGVVLLAYDPQRQKNVAIKVPRPEMLLNSKARERFLLEAKTVASLVHPNIVQVLEVGEAGAVCYIAAEYCEGPSLDRYLVESRLGQLPRLTPAQSALLVERLALAVHHVHEQGVLHRDLKPSNVLLWPRGENASTEDPLPFIPQLTDFGLAKFVEQGLEDTASSMLLGTPLYMAPEQAECRRNAIGRPTDIYALGAILYELLTGAPPFVGVGFLNLLDRVRSEPPRPPSKQSRQLPAALDRICLKCLAKEPHDRYPTAQALADDLRRFREGKPVVASGPSVRGRVKNWLRHPQRAVEAGVWAIMLNIGILLWMTGNAVVLFTVATGARGLSHFEVAGSLVFAGLVHLPQAALGWQTLRRKRWAMYIGLTVATGLVAMAVAPLTGAPGPFNKFYPDRLALWNVYWFLTILFSLQWVLFAAAVTAHRSSRNS